ncbi:hypothetical protein INT45_009983 [Circinella minor]|uniref:Uncharacterized protein n=1 Tax=Circinella minor TaxID=1195481 RepID=A0A8H7S6G1_9FUNG|nr:hypothetical protein INT45_009983 [Circinella minor]
MLLKQDKYSTTVREHFRKYGDVLDQVYQIVITKIKRSDHKTFFRELMAQVQDIIYVKVKKGARWECSRKLIELTKGRSDPETAVLFGLSSLVLKLPLKTMLDKTVIGETELWSQYYDLMLANVLPSEGSVSDRVQVRPDAIVCEIDQLSWGTSVAFGEAKLSEPTNNINSSGRDLMRLAILGAKLGFIFNQLLNIIPTRVEKYNHVSYDFNYVVRYLKNSKADVHLACSDVITKIHRNTYQLINKYKLYLNKEQEASKDHTKKCFWDTQAVKLSKTGVTEVWIYQFSNKSLWLNISSAADQKEKNGIDQDNLSQSENTHNSSPPRKKRHIDYSDCFEAAFQEFQVKSLALAATDLGLCVESHLYELL